MECKSSALCIFDEQDVQTDIIGNIVTDYYPLTSLAAKGPIEFHVPGTVDEYIDLSDLTILLHLKITKKDGSNLAAGDKVCFINQAISSVFQDVFLTIADTQVEGGQHCYPYNGYLSSLLQFHPSAKNTHMSSWGWSKDDAAKFNKENNRGSIARALETKNSDVWELMGPLFLDMTRQSRYLIPQTDIRLKLLPATSEFALLSFLEAKAAVAGVGGAAGTPAVVKPLDFTYSIEKCVLYVRRIRVNDSVILAHSKGLEKSNAKYLLQHVDISSFIITKDTNTYVKDHLFPSQMPKMLVIGLLDHDAFSGNMGKNPFNFENFELKKLGLYRDGELVPGQILNMDYDDDKYKYSYLHTMKSLKFYNTDDTNGMTLDEFCDGFNLYAFDLTPDNNCQAKYRSVTRNSSLRLELSFRKNLPRTVNVLLFAVFDSKLEITKLRDIILSHNR